MATNAVDKSLVLALDDKWGNGKTSFVKMMESEIQKNHSELANVIYFDAFKSDYQSDPFVALTANIYALTHKEDGKLKSLGNQLLSIGKKLGASFAINGSKLAIGSITGGLVSGTVIEKAGETISESISSPLEDYIEEKIKTSEKEIATIEKFGEILTKIHQESNKKIIFIIDELDRARPDFSLDLLEKIKHIFSVEGVIFLLVVNRVQFEKSIESRYGNINSKLYLNKFVHYWFTLPKHNFFAKNCLAGFHQSTIKKYLYSIDEGYNLLSRNGAIANTLAGLLELNDCSLREAERSYSVFTIIDPSVANNYSNEVYKVAIAFVAFLKVHNSSLLTEIILKKYSTNEVLQILNIDKNLIMEVKELHLIKYILDYHYINESDLKKARANQEYADIEGFYGRKVDILNIVYSLVEGFDVSN